MGLHRSRGFFRNGDLYQGGASRRCFGKKARVPPPRGARAVDTHCLEAHGRGRPFPASAPGFTSWRAELGVTRLPFEGRCRDLPLEWGHAVPPEPWRGRL